MFAGNDGRWKYEGGAVLLEDGEKPRPSIEGVLLEGARLRSVVV